MLRSYSILELPPILTTLAPTEWLRAPEWMNVHYFLRAEKCPRSAALRHSRYATIWDRNGYPDKPSIAAASGTVIHIAVARLVTELAIRGCTSTSDPIFCAILKELGGYSNVIADAISEVEAGLAKNPRFQPIRDFLAVTLRSRIPRFRENIQLQLSRLKWAAYSPTPVSPKSHEHVGSKLRHPLAPGSHFEVEIRDPILKWRGIADLIELTDSCCSITDFKSGSSSDDHVFQIRLYALLWLRDTELNPEALPASSLTLSYPSEQKDIDFQEADQTSFRSELQARTKLVRAAITGTSSKAVLSGDICPQCDVRQLCKEYWTSARPIPSQQNVSNCRFDDVQLLLKSKKGESTWLAEAQIASYLKIPAALLLRWSSEQFRIFEHLKPGTMIRLTGALLSDVHDEYPVLTCVANTDVIVL